MFGHGRGRGGGAHVQSQFDRSTVMSDSFGSAGKKGWICSNAEKKGLDY